MFKKIKEFVLGNKPPKIATIQMAKYHVMLALSYYANARDEEKTHDIVFKTDDEKYFALIGTYADRKIFVEEELESL